MKKTFFVIVILALLVAITWAIYYFLIFSRVPDTLNKGTIDVIGGEIKEKMMEEKEVAKEEDGETNFFGSYVDVSAAKALDLIENKKDLVVIDVSPHYDEGRLPGAVWYYLGNGSLDRAIPGLDKNMTYLVYCHVDSVAIAGAERLINAGFTKVYRLEGNYPGWKSDGYPIEIKIDAVGRYTGSAVTTRSFLGGKFGHTVEASIPDPAPGKFYEGWLVKGSSFFSTGKMTKVGGKYVLSYTSSQDSRDYRLVVITEETLANGLDGVPEAHVLEGSF